MGLQGCGVGRDAKQQQNDVLDDGFSEVFSDVIFVR